MDFAETKRREVSEMWKKLESINIDMKKDGSQMDAPKSQDIKINLTSTKIADGYVECNVRLVAGQNKG